MFGKRGKKTFGRQVGRQVEPKASPGVRLSLGLSVSGRASLAETRHFTVHHFLLEQICLLFRSSSMDFRVLLVVCYDASLEHIA